MVDNKLTNNKEHNKTGKIISGKDTVPNKVIHNNLRESNISDYVETSYLDYAMSVVKGRALPDVRDGLKPVHRRIFYAMHKMGITDTSKPVKSARVVGEVIGKYHPHGDQAAYEALVVQSQPFRMNIPVIEGVGNFGSRDGDEPAAQRYTECRFNPISKLFFEEINQNAVKFSPNYDGSEEEPEVLPVKIPYALVNFTEGIAVGMATTIPSHNVNEVIDAAIAFYENRNITLDEILTHIKGPDFPTAGQIISSNEDIYKVYQEGRGAFRIRGKYNVEEEDKKHWKLVFNELPYGVSVKTVLEEIDAIFNPEDKQAKGTNGKVKKITPEQNRLKLLYLNNIDNFRDESDKDNPVRLVIEPKSYKQSPEELALILLSTTSLETNFNANCVFIATDGKPRQMPLLEIIEEWCDFRVETIKNRCLYQIEKINNRLHILSGRRIILEDIDNVIRIIKNSDNRRAELKEKYNLSDIQVEDILSLQLRQIGNLEFNTLMEEITSLNKRKDELEKILKNNQSLIKQAIKELKEEKKNFINVDRKTLIKAEEKISMSDIEEKSAKVAEEEITITISDKDWLKVYKGVKTIDDIQLKGDSKIKRLFHCKNTDTLVMFDENGKVYNTGLNNFGREAIPINTIVSMTSRLAMAFPLNQENKYLMVQDKGFGYITKSNNLLSKVKNGKDQISIIKGSKLLTPLEISNNDIQQKHIAFITSANKLIVYKLSDISEINKGKGVSLCKLDNDKIIDYTLCDEQVKLQINGKQKPLIIEGDEFKKYVKNRSASLKGYEIKTKDSIKKINFV